MAPEVSTIACCQPEAMSRKYSLPSEQPTTSACNACQSDSCSNAGTCLFSLQSSLPAMQLATAKVASTLGSYLSIELVVTMLLMLSRLTSLTPKGPIQHKIT